MSAECVDDEEHFRDCVAIAATAKLLTNNIIRQLRLLQALVRS